MKANQSVRRIVRVRGLVLSWVILGLVGLSCWSGQSLASRFGQLSSTQTINQPVSMLSVGDILAAAR